MAAVVHTDDLPEAAGSKRKLGVIEIFENPKRARLHHESSTYALEKEF